MEFPTIREVSRELKATMQEILRLGPIEPDEEGYESVDVRLQVYQNGDWAIRWGESSYDTDHHGYWGASSMDVDILTDTHARRELAEDLLSQAEDAYAEDVASGRCAYGKPRRAHGSGSYDKKPWNDPGDHVVFVDYGTHVFYRFGTGGFSGRGQFQGSDPTLGKSSKEIIAKRWKQLRKDYPSLKTYEVIEA